MAYKAKTDRQLFSLYLNVESLMIAVAINTGKSEARYLEKIPRTNSTLTTGGLVYNVNSYVHPLFPNMAAILCLDRIDDKGGIIYFVCFVSGLIFIYFIVELIVYLCIYYFLFYGSIELGTLICIRHFFITVIAMISRSFVSALLVLVVVWNAILSI